MYKSILELIINLVIIIGTGFLFYFYLRLKHIDSKIKELNGDFEQKRDAQRNRNIGTGITTSIQEGQIAKLQGEKDEKIAPLERERQTIISKIPFIK